MTTGSKSRYAGGAWSCMTETWGQLIVRIISMSQAGSLGVGGPTLCVHVACQGGAQACPLPGGLMRSAACTDRRAGGSWALAQPPDLPAGLLTGRSSCAGSTQAVHRTAATRRVSEGCVGTGRQAGDASFLCSTHTQTQTHSIQCSCRCTCPLCSTFLTWSQPFQFGGNFVTVPFPTGVSQWQGLCLRRLCWS